MSQMIKDNNLKSVAQVLKLFKAVSPIHTILPFETGKVSRW